MQRLRKLLPILFALVLVVATVAVMGIMASADTTTVSNVWLVSTPTHSQRAYNNIKVIRYDTGAQSTNTSTNASLSRVQNFGWGATNIIQYATIGTTAYSTNGASLTITVVKLADSIDRAEVDKLWGLPVVIEIDNDTKEVVAISVEGSYKAITTDRIDAVAWNGGAAFFLDGEYITAAGGFNGNGRRWGTNFSSGGYLMGYALQVNTGVNSGTIAEYDGNANTNSNPRYAANAQYAPDILYLVDRDNNGTYDWSFLRSVTIGTPTVLNPGTAVTFKMKDNSTNGNAYTITNAGGSAWLTGTTGHHYLLNGTLDSGADTETEYYIRINWGNDAGGWDGVYYELNEVGDSVSDLRVVAKSGNIAYNSTADDLIAYVTVYGDAEAVATITDVSYNSSTGYLTVTATYLGETETCEVFVPTGLAITNAPTKTAYQAGDAIDTTGMTVAVTFQGGTTAVSLEDCEITETANSSDPYIYVSYMGFTASTPIDVLSPNGIAVTAPTKTVYGNGELIDTTGMTVSLTFSNNTSTPISLDECTITTRANIDDPRIVVTYGDYSEEIAITVNPVVENVANVFLVSTPHFDIRAYNGMRYTYFGGTQQTGTATGQALTYAYNNGWGMNNVIAYQAMGSTGIGTGGTTSSTPAVINATIVRVADDAELRAQLDQLWWLPVNLTLERQADGVYSVTAVSVAGTLKVVTSDRVDAVSWDGGAAFYLDGKAIDGGFNGNEKRWAWNTSSGGIMTSPILQGTGGFNSGNISDADGVANQYAGSGNPRYEANRSAPDIVYFVDTDNNGNNDFEWCLIRSVTRGTANTLSTTGGVKFTFTSTGNTANGNGYTLTGAGGSAWLTGGTVKHYALAGNTSAFDTGASVGSEYYIMTNVGGFNATGFNSFWTDLYPIGSVVSDTFTSLSFNSTAFSALDQISSDMIDAFATVYGIAEAKVEISEIEIVDDTTIAVTGEYLGETVTGQISGIEIKTFTGISIAFNSLVLSAEDVTVSDITVKKLYSDGSFEIADIDEIDSITPIGDNDDEIRVVVRDMNYGGTQYADTKLFYSGEYYISATVTKNYRGHGTETVKVGSYSFSPSGSQTVLQTNVIGNYVTNATAFAVSPINGASPTTFVVYSYNGNYSDIESHYMMPVTVYCSDAEMTDLLAVTFNENDVDVLSLRDFTVTAGQYYVGADEFNIDSEAILYYRSNGQYLYTFNYGTIFNNAANGTYANAGNVYSLDTDGDGDYDWFYYEPMYLVEGVTSVGLSGTVPTVRFANYTRGNMIDSADSSVYNWFLSGSYRYGVNGGTVTSGIAAGDSNYYLTVYMQSTSGSPAGSAYYTVYAESGTNGRYYPTTIAPVTTTLSRSYLVGGTIPVEDLPAIHVVRNDGSAANIKLTAAQVNNAAELVVDEDTTELTVNATVDGRTFEFTISGFTVTAAPSELRVIVADGVTFTNGVAISKSILTVEADFEVRVGRVTQTETRTIAADDYTLISTVADIDDPYVRISYLGMAASTPITVHQNVQQLVLYATFTRNARTSDNMLAAPAANKVAFVALGQTYASATHASLDLDVRTIADGVTVSDSLVLCPVAVEFNAAGELVSIEELGTSITMRASDLTATYNPDTDSYYDFTFDGNILAIDESILEREEGLNKTNLWAEAHAYHYAIDRIGSTWFIGDSDEIVTLYDIDDDGDYDFAVARSILNGSVVLEVSTKEYNNRTYNIVYLGGTAGSYASTGWITYTKGNYFVYELADGVDSIAAGDYVNFELTCDASLPYAAGTFQSGGHPTFPCKVVVTSKATIVEGLVNSVNNPDNVHISFKINDTDYVWSSCTSTYAYADGANLEVCGRTTFADNGIYKLVLDESGNVVRTLESELTATGLSVEAANGKTVFIAGKAYTNSMFEATVTLSNAATYKATGFEFNKAAPEVGDTAVTITVACGETELEDTLEITVVGASLTQAYYQIASGTTLESASTRLRFVAGIADLDHAAVGFVFSLTDSTLDEEYLASEDFLNLAWRDLMDNSSVKLQRATNASGDTYFRLTTKTVYDSVIADGVRRTASSFGTNYLFACTFTGVPNSYFNNTFAARSYTKTRISPDTADYDYEYSSTLTVHTIAEMIG